LVSRTGGEYQFCKMRRKGDDAGRGSGKLHRGTIRLFQPDFCRYGGRAAGEQGHDQNASQAHDD
jgi:hypothetical protein